MPPLDFRHKGPRVLLTEGKNDCHVILALCRKHNVHESFGFFDCGSDDKVLKTMSALIAGSERKEVIGVVLDADNPNLRAKWDSISTRLAREGYAIPANPLPDGTILQCDGKPTVGVWLMPDNNIDGMLEDFCASLASPDAIGYARECVATAQARSFSSFIANHQSKAVVHTFLAWQQEPGMPLGQAITANSLDGEHHVATSFTAFLNRLFIPA